MINKILHGITVKLDETFGMPIYTENVKQGFDEPCFYVAEISTNTSPQLGSRLEWKPLFDIHYFPEIGREECNAVLSKLLEHMAVITLSDGNMINAYNMNGEYEDGVLHFFVNYNLIMCTTPQEKEYMEDIEIGETV